MPAQINAMTRVIKVTAKRAMTKQQSDDPLSSLAPLLRVKPELQDLCRFGGSWAGPHEAIDAAQFHIVTRGACLLEREGLGPLESRSGRHSCLATRRCSCRPLGYDRCDAADQDRVPGTPFA